jgi:hypothetical protein
MLLVPAPTEPTAVQAVVDEQEMLFRAPTDASWRLSTAHDAPSQRSAKPPFGPDPAAMHQLADGHDTAVSWPAGKVGAGTDCTTQPDALATDTATINTARQTSRPTSPRNLKRLNPDGPIRSVRPRSTKRPWDTLLPRRATSHISKRPLMRHRWECPRNCVGMTE